MALTILGIDPGLTGALALYAGGETLIIYDMPTYVAKKKTKLDLDALDRCLHSLAEGWHVDYVFIERVGAMPRQGVSSAFNFGFVAGALHALVVAHFGTTACRVVTPQQWKFGVGIDANPDHDKKARKATSRARAVELFPSHADLFKRAKDDGRAEAALIAWYGAKQGRAALSRIAGEA